MSGSIPGPAEAARTADLEIPEILRGDDDLPQVLADTVTEILHTPSARGAIHLVCAAVAIIAGAALVPVAWLVGRPHAGLATLVYATTIIGMFTVSAVYHRVRWHNPATYKWMKRADHSMIFLFIAGSYTPLALLAMPPDTAKLVLTIVYSGAVAGVALKMFWPSAPRWVGVPLYLVLGYTAIWFAGVLLDGARPGRRGPALRRRRALQHRRGSLRRPLAQPVAADVRLSRVLPCVHRGGRRLPLRRDLVASSCSGATVGRATSAAAR